MTASTMASKPTLRVIDLGAALDILRDSSIRARPLLLRRSRLVVTPPRPAGRAKEHEDLRELVLDDAHRLLAGGADEASSRKRHTRSTTLIVRTSERRALHAESVTLDLLGERRSHMGEKSRVASSALGVASPRFGQAQGTIRPTSDHLRVTIILAVVFPEANRTHFKGRAVGERQVPATRALSVTSETLVEREGHQLQS
jgi:hypothetical protein